MKKISLLIVITVFIILLISRFIDFSPAPPVAPEPRESASRLSELLSGDGAEGYSKAIEKRIFRFPEDHGPHPGFRNEWWYLTGNLDDERGQRFGFELTFFRFALRPGPHLDSALSPGSGWRTHQVYIAHFAVTDEKNEQFHVAQRFLRDALGLAGAQTTPFKVWIENWSIKEKQNKDIGAVTTEDWEITASDDDFSLHLNLLADKPPVLNGADGLSQKSTQSIRDILAGS